MSQGDVVITITDGGLNQGPQVNPRAFSLYGVCSLGTPETVYNLATIEDIKTYLGYGPLAEAYGLLLSLTGPGHVAIPVTSDVVAVHGAVTAHRVATSDGDMVVTAAASKPANNAFKLRAQVISVGTGQKVSDGTLAVRFSLDDGQNWGQRTIVPSTGSVGLLALDGTNGITSVPTGMEVTFDSGSETFDYGDYFTMATTAPYYGTANFSSAAAAALGDATPWNLGLLVGTPASAADAAAMAAAADLFAAAAFSGGSFGGATVMGGRDMRAIMASNHCADTAADTTLVSAFQAFSSRRVMVSAGGTDTIISALDGRQMYQEHALPLACRLAAIPPKQSPGVVDDGPLSAVVAIGRDERRRPTLFDQRFSVAQTRGGYSGFFNDIGNVMAPVGSDYKWIMRGRVIDLVATACRAAGYKWLNKTLGATAAGTLDPVWAQMIKDTFDSQVKRIAGGQYNAARTIVNMTDKVTETNKIRVTERVQPYPHAAEVEIDVGFAASF
jgi:hypothetical protein